MLPCLFCIISYVTVSNMVVCVYYLMHSAGVTMTLSRGPMVKLANWLIAGAGVRTERDVER